jgi:replicative DNA helicase Mcm
MNTDHELLEDLVAFYEDYCKQDILKLAQHYPNDTSSLTVDYDDLWRHNPDFAADLRNHPDDFLTHMEDAVAMVDIPLDVGLEDVTVRVTDVEDEYCYAPGEVRKDEAGKYIGVTGTLERVTTAKDLPETLVWECDRDGRQIEVPQDPTADDTQEPYECPNCTRQGPFTVNHRESEWSDYVKLRIQSRPDTAADAEGKLVGFALDDLIDAGGENGLLGRAGEPVTVYGIVNRVQQDNGNTLLFDHKLEARAIEFDRDNQTVDVDEHREAFTDLAEREDTIELWRESIAPQLHATDAWNAAMEFAIAYLFGAPRIDIPGGPTYRGDLHFLMVSDYGMGKSTFKEDIEAYSPKCLSKSTTALSSDVGLTAAAVKDDFGEGQWTVKPGLLVRANGGHLLLDEIDKGPDELTNMNDALEGEQVVDIEKAGQSATYESRTAVMAMGNPVDGRFDPNAPVAEELGISESLLSRFDGIVTMRDTADVEQDEKIAETFGRAYTEAQAKQYGDRDEFDELDRPVPIDVGQAWIQYAREEVTPTLSFKQFETLKEWYAGEVRQLNETFAGDGEGGDMPVPATVRELAAAVKMAIAFARANLRDEVAAEDVERAKSLGKKLVKQNWDGEQFSAVKNHGSRSEFGQLKPDVLQALAKDGPLFADELARLINTDEDRVREALEQYKKHGDVIDRNGKFEVP